VGCAADHLSAFLADPCQFVNDCLKILNMLKDLMTENNVKALASERQVQTVKNRSAGMIVSGRINFRRTLYVYACPVAACHIYDFLMPSIPASKIKYIHPFTVVKFSG